MSTHQPFDVIPNLADEDLYGAWLNRGVRGMGDCASDYGPNGYDMTRVGTPGQARVGMHFTAASLQYLRRAEADWRGGDSFGVISAWIKLDSVGVAHRIFTSADEAADNNYWMFSVEATNHLSISAVIGGTGRTVTGDTTLVADRWYRVSAMSDGGTWALYVDNERETVTPGGAGNDGSWLSDVPNRDNVCIGGLRTSIILQYFDGTIKDVRYHGLTVQVPSDVTHEFAVAVPDASLVLWTIGGMEDLSRYKRPLTRFNSVICGHEMHFDSGAPADYIRAAAIPFVDQSASLWFKPDSAGNNEILFNNTAHDTNRTVIAIRADATVRAGHWSGASYRPKSGGAYEVGKWNHIMFSYDDAPTRTMRAWLNRVELTDTDDPSSGNGVWLRLGQSSSGTSPYNGLIRDVRVWNEPKSEGFAFDIFDKGEASI